jgi:hypothetical protein
MGSLHIHSKHKRQKNGTTKLARLGIPRREDNYQQGNQKRPGRRSAFVANHMGTMLPKSPEMLRLERRLFNQKGLEGYCSSSADSIFSAFF